MARLLRRILFWFVTAVGVLGVTATAIAWWGSWFLWPFPDPREPGRSLYNGSNFQWCGPQLELVASGRGCARRRARRVQARVLPAARDVKRAMRNILRKSVFWFVTVVAMLGLTATAIAWWGSWFLWPFEDPRTPDESKYHGSNYRWSGPQAELGKGRTLIGMYHVYGGAHFHLYLHNTAEIHDRWKGVRASWTGYHSRHVYTHPEIEADPRTAINQRIFLYHGRLLVSYRHVTSQLAKPEKPIQWQYWKIDIYIPHWLLLLLWLPLLLPALIVLRRRHRSRRWQRQGRCAGCGYDLTHLESDKCPECGAPAPATNHDVRA
jgi:hypothetical protein